MQKQWYTVPPSALSLHRSGNATNKHFELARWTKFLKHSLQCHTDIDEKQRIVAAKRVVRLPSSSSERFQFNRDCRSGIFEIAGRQNAATHDSPRGFLRMYAKQISGRQRPVIKRGCNTA